MHYKYKDFFLFYRNGHLAILAVKVFWVKIIVASLYGNNQLAVAVKKVLVTIAIKGRECLWITLK